MPEKDNKSIPRILNNFWWHFCSEICCRSPKAISSVRTDLCNIKTTVKYIYKQNHVRTTHEWAMCRVPFLAQNVKGQGHTGRLKFSAHPLRNCAYLIDSLHTWHKYNLSGRCVTCCFGVKRSKAKITWVILLAVDLSAFTHAFYECKQNYITTGTYYNTIYKLALEICRISTPSDLWHDCKSRWFQIKCNWIVIQSCWLASKF